MNGNQQFTIAILIGIPTALSALGAFITALVAIVRQGRHNTEQQEAISDLHTSVDGKMERLLSLTASDSHSQGMTDQREQTKQDDKDVLLNKIITP